VKLTVRPYSADLSLSATYKEPMLGLAQEELRLPLVKRILKSFELRLDQLSFDATRLSGNYFQFTKQFGSALFGLHFGLEETSANLFKAENVKQAFDILGRLSPILDEIPIASMRINISRHFEATEEARSFLASLNPTVPVGFKEFLDGGGVFYNLRISNHNLNLYITLVDSLLIKNGLFLGIENQFLPYPGGLMKSASIVLEYNNLILNELGIIVETGGKNG
jgi:hypothetical protein